MILYSAKVTEVLYVKNLCALHDIGEIEVDVVVADHEVRIELSNKLFPTL